MNTECRQLLFYFFLKGVTGCRVQPHCEYYDSVNDLDMIQRMWCVDEGSVSGTVLSLVLGKHVYNKGVLEVWLPKDFLLNSLLK